VRSVSDINESDPDFEEQLVLLYPNLSKRKDRLKSYKAQRKARVAKRSGGIVNERWNYWRSPAGHEAKMAAIPAKPDRTMPAGPVQPRKKSTTGMEVENALESLFDNTSVFTGVKFTGRRKVDARAQQRKQTVIQQQQLNEQTYQRDLAEFEQSKALYLADPEAWANEYYWPGVAEEVAKQVTKVIRDRETAEYGKAVAKKLDLGVGKAQVLAKWGITQGKERQQESVEQASERRSKAMELKDLFELHQMGGLTDEEYATAKAQVLGG